jgi:hypothetical protein
MARKLPDSVQFRFNSLLIDVFQEAPPVLDLIGLAKFHRGESAESWRKRKDLLHTVLETLGDSVDLDAIFDALFKAKQERTRAYLEGFRIDYGREFEKDRERASRGLKDARRFLKDCGYENDGYEDVLAKLSAVINREWPGPARRSHAGHQPEPWLKEVRRNLAQAKVPKEKREELLVAVGLIADNIEPDKDRKAG